jgi:hypothetical protein
VIFCPGGPIENVDKKFPNLPEIGEKFEKYNVNYIIDFFTYFDYKFYTQGLINLFFLDFDVREQKGFRFSLLSHDAGKDFFPLKYFLVLSSPEQVLEDFERFLELGPFYDGKITTDI